MVGHRIMSPRARRTHKVSIGVHHARSCSCSSTSGQKINAIQCTHMPAASMPAEAAGGMHASSALPVVQHNEMLHL
jgi:hypothetical protein